MVAYSFVPIPLSVPKQPRFVKGFHPRARVPVKPRLSPNSNPNGIASLSPGLRGTSYPGSPIPKYPPTLKGLNQSYTYRSSNSLPFQQLGNG